jgi:putative acetyltransferase
VPPLESSSFRIRTAASAEEEALFDIWWRSASHTHTFLSQDALAVLVPSVRRLRLATPDTWVLCEGAGQPIAFIMLNGPHVDALFVAPEWIGRGAGGALLRHARSLHKRLTVDVNEQNIPALSFYRAKGFVVSGRSETDDEGRPFPLLHLTTG